MGRMGALKPDHRLNASIKNDIKSARKMHLPWWGVLCVFTVTLLAAWLFDHRGMLDRTLPVLNSMAVLGLVLAVKWRMRRHVWFWITMTAIAVLHIPLIFFIPWPAGWVPAAVFAGLASVDFCIVIAIVDVVANSLPVQETAECRSPPP